MAENICFIALGSNLGDRPHNLALAREHLSENVEILNSSSIYETEPWGVTDQPLFLNQVLEGRTSLNEFDLLKFCKQIEQTLGRRKTFRYGPRMIDLDILIFDHLILNTPDLILPHPRLTERAFVLVPLAEITPDFVLPGTYQSIRELLLTVDTSGVKRYEGES